MKVKTLVTAGSALLFLSGISVPSPAATPQGGQYKVAAKYCVPGRPGCERPPPSSRPLFHFYFWYGPYPPPYYYNYHDHYYHQPYTVRVPMSCKSARRLLSRDGFRNLTTKDCEGRYYEFNAIKGGHKYRIRLNAYTGRYTWNGLK